MFQLLWHIITVQTHRNKHTTTFISFLRNYINSPLKAGFEVLVENDIMGRNSFCVWNDHEMLSWFWLWKDNKAWTFNFAARRRQNNISFILSEHQSTTNCPPPATTHTHTHSYSHIPIISQTAKTSKLTAKQTFQTLHLTHSKSNRRQNNRGQEDVLALSLDRLRGRSAVRKW